MNTIPVPIDKFVKNGPTLQAWLGTFWNHLYTDKELVHTVQQGNGLYLAQLYLDYLESLKLLDRSAVPVMHRERWYPVVLRRSQRNHGAAALLKVGMQPNTPVIGPQTGTGFVAGKLFQIGGYAEFDRSTNYPLAATVQDIMTCVTDNIMKPSVVLTAGVDYLVRENTIFFLRTHDPFESDVFPRRTFLNEDGVEDQEILLWGCDTLFDKNYIYNYMGYVLRIKSKSTEFYRAMLNGLWNLYNMGTPLAYLQEAIGLIVGEPTVKQDGEIVTLILQNPANQQIITDQAVYTVAKNATLRASVKVDATLKAGEFLTETIRLYPRLDPTKLAAVSEFGERMRQDIISLFFGKQFFTTDLDFGIGANWELSNIINTGKDAHGNPKLKFTVFGSDHDVDTFWTSFWHYLEERNISSETCFKDYVDAIVVNTPGAVYGRVMPLEFFMRYFLRYNAFVIIIERDKLLNNDEDTLHYITTIRDVLPAHTYMWLIEHRTITSAPYNLGALGSTVDKVWAQLLYNTVSPGLPNPIEMTYTVRQPRMKWIPACK